MTEREIRRHTKFDVQDAKLDVWYTLWYLGKTWRGKPKWRQVRELAYDGAGGTYRSPVSGDRQWAKKIATHYNIALPPTMKSKDNQ